MIQNKTGDIVANITCYTFRSDELFLSVGMQRIVDGEMKATTLLTLYRLTRDEIAHVNHVAEFADIIISPTSFTLCVMSTCSSLVIVPSSFHSGILSLKS